MRARLPWILFFISLALNISILAGVLYVGHHKLFGEKRGMALIEEVAEDLDLTEAQATALRDLRRQAVEEREKLDQEAGRLSDVMLAALREEKFNSDSVRWFLIERGQPWREFFVDAMGRMHAFLWSLDARQREVFLTRAAEERDFLRNLFRPERDR
ncbi:MAG TPA: hypothetical protein VJL84_09175 [Kiloniellales bacterium]|nr:hypothetical protein [Kiloniellales bacterium]